MWEEQAHVPPSSAIQVWDAVVYTLHPLLVWFSFQENHGSTISALLGNRTMERRAKASATLCRQSQGGLLYHYIIIIIIYCNYLIIYIPE